MATRLNPYISFNGDAREALEFYKGIFGGTLALSTFGEFGNPGEGGDKIDRDFQRVGKHRRHDDALVAELRDGNVRQLLDIHRPG